MARFHQETKKKKQFEVFVTDRQRDRQTESIVDNNRLLGYARRSAITPSLTVWFQDVGIPAAYNKIVGHLAAL